MGQSPYIRSLAGARPAQKVGAGRSRFDRDEIVTIVRNGIEASLMTPSEKNEAFAEINRVLATIA